MFDYVTNFQEEIFSVLLVCIMIFVAAFIVAALIAIFSRIRNGFKFLVFISLLLVIVMGGKAYLVYDEATQDFPVLAEREGSTIKYLDFVVSGNRDFFIPAFPYLAHSDGDSKTPSNVDSGKKVADKKSVANKKSVIDKSVITEDSTLWNKYGIAVSLIIVLLLLYTWLLKTVSLAFVDSKKAMKKVVFGFSNLVVFFIVASIGISTFMNNDVKELRTAVVNQSVHSKETATYLVFGDDDSTSSDLSIAKVDSFKADLLTAQARVDSLTAQVEAEPLWPWLWRIITFAENTQVEADLLTAQARVDSLTAQARVDSLKVKIETNSPDNKKEEPGEADGDSFLAGLEWYFKLLLFLLITIIPIWLIRSYKTKAVQWALSNVIILSIGSLIVIIGGMFIYDWYAISIFYEIIFMLVVLISAAWLFQRISVGRNLAPQESEESMVPYAFDPSKANPKVSKDGESLEAYTARRQRSIDALKEENAPYGKRIPNFGIASLIIMTLTIVIGIFVNWLMVLAFLAWAVYMGYQVFSWFKNVPEHNSDDNSNEDSEDDSNVSPDNNFFNAKNIWKISLRLLGVYMIAIIISLIFGAYQWAWSIFGSIFMDLLLFGAFTVIMAIGYFVGCVYIVPIRRRWVFTVFNKVIKAEQLIIYTPNTGTVHDLIKGLYSEEIRKTVEENLKDIDIKGTNWLDVGINIGLLSWLFVGVVDIISNYYMVIEATKQTRLLPTKGLKRDDLDIKTKSAGTVSFFFRFFYLLGVDPLVSSRLSIVEREEAVAMAGRVIEGHLANKAKLLSFDDVMLYPFHEHSEISEQPEDFIRLISSLNREFLILAGAYVLKFNIIDRDPEEIIQKAMDKLTALVYEVDQAATQAEKDRLELKGKGEGRADEIEAVAKILKDPENKAAMELLIRMKGAETASIHSILEHFGSMSKAS